jgi:hypothetical protein
MVLVFRRMFPTLADWPSEKWLGVPIALLFVLGAVGGAFNLAGYGTWLAG